MSTETQIDIFSTCPPSSRDGGPDYLEKAVEVARWSEQVGCEGILVYSDNSQVDPWLVAQAIIQGTDHIAPLVAVQPVYMHPYTVAKTVASIANVYRRKIYLNMVAGGFKNDLLALDDRTPHDDRYVRLVEYTTIIKNLLEDKGPVNHSGKYYKVQGLRISPHCPEELRPEFFISGSSSAGREAAFQIGATAIEYPKPASEGRERLPKDAGIRIGLISRARKDDAWASAHKRFPLDFKGKLTHQLAMKVSDSVWHRQLSQLAREQVGERHPYWLVPFENYKSMCPYLVGDYDEVGQELAAYIRLGYKTFITDVPQTRRDMQHMRAAFDRAQEIGQCQPIYKTG
jgi:alkanesulfonate monooxygenase